MNLAWDALDEGPARWQVSVHVGQHSIKHGHLSMRQAGFEPDNPVLQPSVDVWAVDRVTMLRCMYEYFG
jgi:hypothetical protein